MEDHLRQVVFIGLGDMHIEGDQGLNGLILHANGECDLARTHLVSLSLTEGKSFKASPFEDKLKNFFQESGELQSDLKKHIEEKQGR